MDCWIFGNFLINIFLNYKKRNQIILNKSKKKLYKTQILYQRFELTTIILSIRIYNDRNTKLL
jgi:hypothetical protein